MTNPITFPTAATLREQSRINGESLHNLLAGEFLRSIKSAQAEFEEYTIVLHTSDEPGKDAPRHVLSPNALADVFDKELSRQITELGLDSNLADKETHIKSYWQGGSGSAGCLCDMLSDIKDELVQLGYGVCDLERISRKDDSCLALGILVTWKNGYHGKLFDEHCNDSDDEAENRKCKDLLQTIMRTTDTNGWEISN